MGLGERLQSAARARRANHPAGFYRESAALRGSPLPSLSTGLVL
jgi:hypothetical protein